MKFLKINYALALVLLSFLLSCIDEFPLPLVSSRGPLVIDGMISNGGGPVTVRLSWAYAVDRNFDSLEGVPDAQVEICDDLGVCVKLREYPDGVYRTSSLRGQTGRSYQLFVRTADNKEYRSSVERILPVGELSSVSHSIDRASDVFEVRASGSFPETDSVSFIKLKWLGVYEVETFPREKVRPYIVQGSESFIWIPNPPACSGLEFIIRNPETFDTVTMNRGDCKCCTCWVQDTPSIPTILESTYIEGTAYTDILVTKVPINAQTLHSKYVLKIVSQGISRTAYNFFRAIRGQKLGVTDLFQPPIGRLPGNVFNPNDPNDEVLGIFYAASVSDTISLSFDKSMVPFQLGAIDSVKEDCALGFKNASVIKPFDW